jgi:hypothetical protein
MEIKEVGICEGKPMGQRELSSAECMLRKALTSPTRHRFFPEDKRKGKGKRERKEISENWSFDLESYDGQIGVCRSF